MSNLRKANVVDSSTNELFVQGNPAIIDFHRPNIDSFGRLRTSSAQTIFDNTLQYDKNTTFTWNEYTSGVGASITHLPNESTVKLEIGTVSGEIAYRQSKRYIRYQPGKSQFVAVSGVMGAIKADVRQRIGLFDTYNGLFFEQDGTNLKVVKRSYTGGTVDDDDVPQSSWNLDTLDGNGPSGKTINMAYSQIFIIDFQWLGVGRVRFGFDINGEKVYCHEMYNANAIDAAYMTTANLPVRLEIENTDTAASSTSMKHICSSVSSESGYTDERGYLFHVGTGSTAVALTVRKPILSIKPKTNFGASTQINRTEILPENYDVLANTNNVYYEIIYNGTLTTPSWIEGSTTCSFEYDVTSTGITGGEVIDGGYIAASNQIRTAISRDILNKFSLCNTIDGTTTLGLPDRLTIAMTAIAATTTTTVSAGITVKQIY